MNHGGDLRTTLTRVTLTRATLAQQVECAWFEIIIGGQCQHGL